MELQLLEILSKIEFEQVAFISEAYTDLIVNIILKIDPKNYMNVEHIFKLYLELGTIEKLQAKLKAKLPQ